MIVKRKKSLSFILVGIALLIFTLTLTKPDLARTRNQYETTERSLTSEVEVESRRSSIQRGKEQNLAIKLHNPLKKSSKRIQKEAKLSTVKENGEKVLKQGTFCW